jgi:hypothetical protein
VPLVDPAILAQLRALNEAKKGDFLKRVVDLYSEHAPKACDQLRQHAKAGKAEACGSLAHSLRLMSRGNSCRRGGKVSRQLEKRRGLSWPCPLTLACLQIAARLSHSPQSWKCQGWPSLIRNST